MLPVLLVTRRRHRLIHALARYSDIPHISHVSGLRGFVGFSRWSGHFASLRQQQCRASFDALLYFNKNISYVNPPARSHTKMRELII